MRIINDKINFRTRLCLTVYRNSYFSAAGNIGLNIYICFVAVNNRCNLYAGCAVIVQIKMIFFHSDKSNITVNSAVEGKVRLLRINKIIRRIISLYFNFVIVLDILKFNPKGGISAVVGAHKFRIKIYKGRGINAVKLQINLLALRHIDFCNFLYIGALASVIIVSAVLTVDTIPCVRKINRAFFVFFYKNPIFINILYISHKTILFVFYIISSIRASY